MSNVLKLMLMELVTDFLMFMLMASALKSSDFTLMTFLQMAGAGFLMSHSKKLFHVRETLRKGGSDEQSKGT